MYKDLRKVEDKARAAGLHRHVPLVVEAATAVSKAEIELEKSARDAFFAARRGVELPK